MTWAKAGLVGFIFLFINWTSLPAQDNSLRQDSVGSAGVSYHQAWSFEAGFEDPYLAQREYQYEEIQQEKNWLERAKLYLDNKWREFWSSLFDGAAQSGFWKVFFQLAPYLLVLILMLLLVWLVMKYSSAGSADRAIGFSTLSADEILLKSDNLKALAEQALQSQDFRLALRYRYLLVLRQLIQRKLIVWKSSKTNYDYQKELQETPFLAPFSEVTRIYNFVWYGHFDLDAKTFGELESAFHHLDHLS